MQCAKPFFLRHGFSDFTAAMQRYADRSGKSGVSGYEILDNGIVLEFKADKRRYLYSYKNPGKKHVEEMKRLASEGKGLTTYVNRFIRENYEKRLT